MNKELRLLNLLCIVAALLLLIMIVVNAITSGDMLSTDNLFVTGVGLVLALMFAVNPLLYLKSEGKLSGLFGKRSPAASAQITSRSSAQISRAASTPQLLDTKGRAVPPDVRAIVAQMGQAKSKDA